MLKIATIVGARPQFIKCAPVSRELRRQATEVLVHTGQHYDDAMSEAFFRELEIPAPDYRLDVGSGSHGVQTGKMLAAVEEVLVREQPDGVLIYGDTNSTLAGALAAAKLHIPVAHVEAGLRSFNRAMPEELNRVVADHLACLHFCPTEAAVSNLAAEGIRSRVHLVGDVMYDALCFNIRIAEQRSTILARWNLAPKGYLLATVHRAENTDDPARLGAILQAFRSMADAGQMVVFPVHPRTRQRLQALLPSPPRNLLLLEPASYLDMLRLEQQAQAVLTDSGGVQKEACWLQVPCVTLRDQTEWVETVASGWNRLAGADPSVILERLAEAIQPCLQPAPLGGLAPAAPRMIEILLRRDWLQTPAA